MTFKRKESGNFSIVLQNSKFHIVSCLSYNPSKLGRKIRALKGRVLLLQTLPAFPDFTRNAAAEINDGCAWGLQKRSCAQGKGVRQIFRSIAPALQALA